MGRLRHHLLSVMLYMILLLFSLSMVCTYLTCRNICILGFYDVSHIYCSKSWFPSMFQRSSPGYCHVCQFQLCASEFYCSQKNFLSTRSLEFGVSLTIHRPLAKKDPNVGRRMPSRFFIYISV